MSSFVRGMRSVGEDTGSSSMIVGESGSVVFQFWNIRTNPFFNEVPVTYKETSTQQKQRDCFFTFSMLVVEFLILFVKPVLMS